MKYLTLLAIALLSVSAHADVPNPALEQALKECSAVIDAKTDRVAFDGCMKAKGFERPKDQPKS